MKQGITIREEVWDGSLETLLDEGHRQPARVSEERLSAFVDVYSRFMDRPTLVNRLRFQEAMGSSDFPNLMLDTLDRQLLAEYEARLPNWRAWCNVDQARDFRDFKYLDVVGGRGVLEETEEFAQSRERAKTEATPITGHVSKYTGRIGISWEMTLNDDLGALKRLPSDLALAARRTEAMLVTNLYVDTTGPDATLYTVGHGNVITGNPALSGSALGDAMGQLFDVVDSDGHPIIYDMVTLVVPGHLWRAANNIKETMQWENVEAGATANQKAYVRNWLAPNFNVEVDSYHSHVCTDANKKHTSWYLFASADAPRPAIQARYLVGEEQPAIFQKMPNRMRVGGGVDPFSFENETMEYSARHVIGGIQVEPKATLASNGSGS